MFAVTYIFCFPSVDKKSEVHNRRKTGKSDPNTQDFPFLL